MTSTHRRGDAACPVCGQQGDEILYGLPAGPPEPGQGLGGCLVDVDNPDYACPSCETTWQVRPVRVLHRGTEATPHD